MLSDQLLETFKPKLLALQIVPLAMMGGAVVFAGAISTMADWSVVDRPFKIFNLIGAGTAVCMYVLAFVVPSLFPKTPDQLPQPGDQLSSDLEEKAVSGIIGLLTTETIIRYALIEGGVMLNLMVLMLEARWVSVIVAGLGFVLMLLCFPLNSRLQDRISDRFDAWRRGR